MLHKVVEVVFESDVDAMVTSGFKYLETFLETTGKDSLWAENALGLVGVECGSAVDGFEVCFVALFPIKGHVAACDLADPLSVEVMISLNVALEIILASTCSLDALFAAETTHELASGLELLSHGTAAHRPGR